MSSIRSILEEVAQMGAEYANFGSPFNTDEDNIAGAEALRQSTIDQALKDISELIDAAKPKFKRINSFDRIVLHKRSAAKLYQAHLKELLK